MAVKKKQKKAPGKGALGLVAGSSRQKTPRKSTYRIERREIPSGSGICMADLYLPETSGRCPVIVMAHGFGACRTFGLPPFAEHFASRGMAVLLFDYRNFGSSPGEPRNLISPRRHLNDWRAAVDYALRLPQIDSSRVALWGSSFSGGHVVETAASRNDIAAICIQVPFSDGLATILDLPKPFVLQAAAHGLRDLLSSASGMGPHQVPVFGKPDVFALLNTPECEKGYGALVNAEEDWVNLAPARIGLTLPLYRPIRKASKIHCPTFIVCAEKDSLVSKKTVDRLSRAIPGSMTMYLDCGHFDLYFKDLFIKNISAQTSFLEGVLKVKK